MSDLQLATSDPATTLSPQDMAVLGNLAASAGLSQTDTRALVALVENVAATAAKQAALAITPALLGMVCQIHERTAMSIGAALHQLPWSAHHTNGGCAAIARSIGQRPPRF